MKQTDVMSDSLCKEGLGGRSRSPAPRNLLPSPSPTITPSEEFLFCLYFVFLLLFKIEDHRIKKMEASLDIA